MDTNTIRKEAAPVKVPVAPVAQAGSTEALQGGGGQSRKGPQLSLQMEKQSPETALRPWVRASTHARDKARGLQPLSHQHTLLI